MLWMDPGVPCVPPLNVFVRIADRLYCLRREQRFKSHTGVSLVLSCFFAFLFFFRVQHLECVEGKDRGSRDQTKLVTTRQNIQNVPSGSAEGKREGNGCRAAI